MQIKELTGLRFVAAFVVLIGHSYHFTFRERDTLAFAGAEVLAYLGMSLFFCLSGFVIYYNYKDIFRGNVGANIYNFAVARFARLYPLYAFAMIVVVGASFPGTTSELIHYVLMLQSWFNTWTVTFLPAWSISTEAFFYVAFVAIGAPLVTLRRPGLALAVLSVVALAISYYFLHRDTAPAVALFSHVAATGHDSAGDVYGWLRMQAPYTRVIEFTMGALAAKIATETDILNRVGNAGARVLIYGSVVLIAGLLSASALAIHADTDWFIVNATANYLYAPAICVLMFAMVNRATLVNRALASRVLVAGGELSYSLYLMQFVAFQRLSGRISDQPLQMAAYIVATFAISVCTYHVIEVHGRRLLRRWLSSRRAVAA